MTRTQTQTQQQRKAADRLTLVFEAVQNARKKRLALHMDSEWCFGGRGGGGGGGQQLKGEFLFYLKSFHISDIRLKGNEETESETMHSFR